MGALQRPPFGVETGPPSPNLAERIFSLDQTLLRRLIEVALSAGGTYADLFFEHRVASHLYLEDDLIKNASRNVDRGVGIRVLCGDQVGFAYSDDLTWEAMARAARTAGAIASDGRKVTVADLGHKGILNLYPVVEPAVFAELSQKVDVLQRANAAARDHSTLVHRVTAHLRDEVRQLVFANSEGVMWQDIQPLLRFDISALAQRGTDRENGYAGGGGRYGLEYFDIRSPEDLARDAVDLALLNLDAREAPAGEMPVVLGAGDSGILLHEAVGHGLEADFNRKGLSNYSGRVGHRVASELCTVVDAGLAPGSRGSINVDDEGNIPDETHLIQDGILQGYLHDRLSAEIMGVGLTGNGRRDSYSSIPLPRMTNTYLLPGQDDPDDIVKSVKFGLYAKRFGGGQVDITKGDYVFSITEGYLIEDGRITAPVRNLTLIGNGPESMNHITMVGNDLRHSDGIWTCGKHGQMVPVGVGMPTVKVRQMTVGGTKAS